MLKKLAVGIDIGGTLTKVGFVDTEGELYAHLDFPTQGYPDVDDYMSVLASKIQYLEKQLSFDFEMMGLGIGAPNANYYRGTIEHAANLEWKGIIPFVSKVKAHFNVPIYMTNDANAAAIGSFIILTQLRPAIVALSFVASLCASLKYAGTVITALFISIFK